MPPNDHAITHGDLNRSLGRVEGKLEEMLEERRTRDGAVDDRLDRIEGDVRAIREMLDKARGGWKVLAIIGGIAGLIGGWIVPTVMKKFLGW